MKLNGIKLSFLIASLASLGGCLPQPEGIIHPQSASLLIQGRIETSKGQPAAQANIFVEQSTTPEAVSADDGSFAFSWDASRLADLHLRYGIQYNSLDLYFVQSTDTPESSVQSSINLLNRGTHDLGLVKLAVEAPVKGRVSAASKKDNSEGPVANARVRIGRQNVVTDANGEFVSTVPLNRSLPMIIEKSGYVQSQSTWTSEASGLEREFKLFSEPLASGELKVLVSPRSASTEPLVLAYSASSFAKWVRVAAAKDTLAQPGPSALAPWQLLKGSLNFSIEKNSSKILYYQFADESQKQLSPIEKIEL